MSNGYEVEMTNLLAMSRTFDTESGTFAAAGKSADGQAPDGGDSMVNEALSEALHAVRLTTEQLGAVVGDHGKKLNGAYEQYKDAEENSTQLCQQLTRLITEK